MKISKGFRREFVEICTDGDGTFYYKKKKKINVSSAKENLHKITR